MRQKQHKNRIITKNKSYPIQDSVFYKLSNKRRLAKILSSTPQELNALKKDKYYRCFNQFKNGKCRPIQQPLPKLDKIHSRVASLLARIETFDGLHSGRKGLSNISNARTHTGAGKRIITADIKSFYPSTKRQHVFDFFFNTMKCQPDIADLLSHILTYNGQIPTGSRVSMPLAYFANKRMFDEMAKTAKASNITMTIYVDDLTFSGTHLKKNFLQKIEIIAKKYRHQIHPSKTRFYQANDTKLITGVAVIGPNVAPRRKHLANYNRDMEEWRSNSEKDISLTNRIQGRLNFLGSIDSRYKDRARTFRQASIKKST